MLPNIKPIIKIAIVSLTLLDTASTAKSTKKLPKLEAITILHLEINVVANNPPNNPEPKMTSATPRLAPDEIPRTNGPAKGFLNSVCMSRPEIPKPEPTRMAVIALGNLKSEIMISQVGLSEDPKRLLKTSCIGIEIEPRLMFIIKQVITKLVSPMNWRAYDF